MECFVATQSVLRRMLKEICFLELIFSVKTMRDRLGMVTFRLKKF
jgi:hypothetical protein